ncbi:conserved hypothetical protein [Burkholderia ambifaria IOP40-10]|uniref:Uncharacterized protein n=1 Tax=Burkholderia ambifaria IOP40-10 TaxID=396596 RepID=B1FS12_9BURK|nr:conserved hypothetical protein [Burkholderia ambifaria IOP40-10]
MARRHADPALGQHVCRARRARVARRHTPTHRLLPRPRAAPARRARIAPCTLAHAAGRTGDAAHRSHVAVRAHARLVSALRADRTVAARRRARPGRRSGSRPVRPACAHRRRHRLARCGTRVRRSAARCVRGPAVVRRAPRDARTLRRRPAARERRGAERAPLVAAHARRTGALRRRAAHRRRTAAARRDGFPHDRTGRGRRRQGVRAAREWRARVRARRMLEQRRPARAARGRRDLWPFARVRARRRLQHDSHRRHDDLRGRRIPCVVRPARAAGLAGLHVRELRLRARRSRIRRRRRSRSRTVPRAPPRVAVARGAVRRQRDRPAGRDVGARAEAALPRTDRRAPRRPCGGTAARRALRPRLAGRRRAAVHAARARVALLRRRRVPAPARRRAPRRRALRERMPRVRERAVRRDAREPRLARRS